MWIQVRSMDGKKSARIDGLSKLTKIEEIREKLVEPFDAAVDWQRLFYRGKQLVDGHTLFDYNVGLNEIIQILIREPPPPATSIVENSESDATDKPSDAAPADLADAPMEEIEPEDRKKEQESTEKAEESPEIEGTYKLGDVIDVRDETMGAWFEAKITKIARSPTSATAAETSEQKTDAEGNTSSVDVATSLTVKPPMAVHGEDDGCDYSIVFERYDDADPVVVTARHIRPRARHRVPLNDVEIGAHVLVNYNYDEPEVRGYWYDAVVARKRVTRTMKELICTVFIGKDLVPFENCKIVFVDEIFEIEKPGAQLNVLSMTADESNLAKRENKPECDHCKDNPNKKCKHCSCTICGDKREPDKQLMCDECDCAYHIYCLKPPLTEIPDVDEWYCPECKVDTSEVVLAGQKLKESKKKSQMPSAQNQTSRDWGKGMACVGRSKHCTIVPPNHFGIIPGVEVGSMWKFRVQVSEAGVHRPPVSGIHGRDNEGAYSIVLSGGYEDDQDDGDTFTYTGSGGRDLSGNKRTAEQSCDQTLTRMNRALAKNCNAPLDPNKGGEAKDWKAGKPVRVVRNCKGRKHSDYAPEEGNRYDGIYKVVKYWPEKGKSGFIVWRYMLRRDDMTPAPWTKEGKKRIEDLGLTMQYPEGWQENNNNDGDTNSEDESSSTPKAEGKAGKRKRKRVKSDDENDSGDAEPVADEQPAKKKKKSSFKVDADIVKLIKHDEKNQKLWDEALLFTTEGSQKFLEKVTELFLCICCQEIVNQPVSTECTHNLCRECLKRSFKADVYNCPMCRMDLGKDFKMSINESLQTALSRLFPGYENGR